MYQYQCIFQLLIPVMIIRIDALMYVRYDNWIEILRPPSQEKRLPVILDIHMTVFPAVSLSVNSKPMGNVII